MFRKRYIAAQVSAALAGCLFASSATMAANAIVDNGSDLGPGSLRDALDSGADKVIIKPSVKTITINDTLVYDGAAPLTIIGVGSTSTVQGTDDFTLLAVTKGADLTIKNLNFKGVGGFSFYSTGEGKGIFIDVLGADKERRDTVKLKLTNVTVSDVAYHGVHVSDCDGGDVCGAGSGSGGSGSPASVYATLKNVVIRDVGFGRSDADGLRIDERSKGGITLRAANSEFTGVGADGIELDEDGKGYVIISVRNVAFDGNGAFCEGLDPTDEAVIDAGCVDEGELDLDDGFDIDEAGKGSIIGSVRNASVANNLDEGLDFDEAGKGDIEVDLVRVSGIGNGDEAIKLSEEDKGDIEADLRALEILDNGDDGIQIEQYVNGEVEVEVRGSTLVGNSKNDLKVESFEDADGAIDGEGTLKVRGSTIDNIDTNVDEI